MRKPGGYTIITSPDDARVNLDGLRCEEIHPGQNEIDTFSCFHCNSVVHVKPRMDPADLGGLCKICFKLICPRCVGLGCSPFEKRLEQAERKNETKYLYAGIGT